MQNEIDNLIAEHIENRIPLQPQLIVIGTNIGNLTDFYIYFNNFKFKFPTFREALDVQIKLMFIFNVEYPIVSRLVWCFIQEYFYEINYSTIHPKVKMWVKKFKQFDKKIF